MRKRPSAAPAASSHPFRLAWAVVALLAMGASGAQAANAASAPVAGAAGSSYCLLVKNAAAKEACLAARKQFNSKQYRAALVTMRKAIDASPKEGILRAVIARVMVAINDTGSAERELRQARTDGAPDHAVLPLLFDVMIARHDENRLLGEFADPAPGAKGDSAADILQGRARALRSLGRLDEAVTAIDRTLSLRRDVTGLLDRADLATRQNNKALATKLVDEAYRLDPKDGGAAFAELKQIQNSNDTAKTLAFSEQMLKLFPNRIDTRVVRIETFLKLNRKDEARAEVNAILASSPKSAYGLFYEGLMLAQANDKNGAWQLMLQIPPAFAQRNPALGSQIAQIAFDTGHVEVGATILANIIAAAPDLLDVRLQLANLKLKQNSPQSALVVLTPVNDSSDPRVKKLLAAIHAQIAKDRAF